jgi:predicted  nucleic acid-binding Zn-ribbon protein
MAIIEQLNELHRLHQALHEIEEALARGPRQIRARDQLVKNLEKEIEDKKTLIKETRALADRKGLDLKTKEVHLQDLSAKLNQATSNREYDVLKGQIEADTVAKSVLEDEIIEQLDKVDRLRAEVAEAEETKKQRVADRDAFAARFEQDAVGLRQKSAELSKQIGQAENFLSGDKAMRYRRLVESHGGHDSMASVEENACSNCRVTITSQHRMQLRMGEVIFCSSCGRLLYQPLSKS